MSVQAMTWVIEHSRHKSGHFVVLLMIANHADRYGDNSFASITTLADESRLTRRQVLRIIPELEASGELQVHRPQRRGQRQSYSVSGMKAGEAPPKRGKSGDKLSPVGKEEVVTFATQSGDIHDRQLVTSATSSGDISTRKVPVNEVNDSINPVNRFESNGNSTKKKSSRGPSSTWIAGVIEDYSRLFKDVDHVIQNTHQALRLWSQHPELSEAEFVEVLHDARNRTQRAKSRPANESLRNPMAYFFRVVRGLLSGDTVPEEPPNREVPEAIAESAPAQTGVYVLDEETRARFGIAP